MMFACYYHSIGKDKVEYDNTETIDNEDYQLGRTVLKCTCKRLSALDETIHVPPIDNKYQS